MGEAWISFTAKKKARYAFTMTNASNVSYTGYGSLDEAVSLKANLFEGDYNEGVLGAGERFYYKFENDNDEKAEVKLKIAEIVPAEATVETPGSVSAKAAYQAWFRFTAASAGRYEFSAEAVQGENKNTPARLGSQADLLKTSVLVSAPLTLTLNAGEVRYIRVPAVSAFDSAKDAAVTLKVKKLTGETLTAGADKGLSFKTGDLTKYLEFTAPADGIYTLSAKAGEAAAGVTVQYYVNQETGVHNLYSLPASVSFKKDDRILFAFTSAAEQEVTVSLKQEEIKTIPAAGGSYAIKDGAPLYLEVPSDEEVRYFVETYDVPEGVKLSFTGTEGSAQTKQSVGRLDSGYLSFVGTRAETVIYKVTSTGAAEEKKFGIRSGLVTPAEIKDGEVKTTAELLPGHMQWFRFTPQEAGEYTVKAKGAGIYSFYNGLTGRFDLRGEDLLPVPVEKYKINQPIFFAISRTGEKKTVDFKVSKVTPKELTEQAAVKVDPKEVDAGEKVRIHFTAPSDGRYTFTADAPTGIETGIDIDIVPSSGSAVEELYPGSEVLLNKGDELTFDITYSRTPEKEFEVKVSSVKPEPLPADTLKKDYTGLTSGDVKWLSFTPGKTAVYTFTLTGCEVSVYPKLTSEDESSYFDEYGMILDKDRTVYIKVTAQAENASVKAAEDTENVMQALTFGENTIEGIIKPYIRRAYFTATEAGFYRFKAEANDNVVLSVKTGRNDYGSWYNDGRDRIIGLDIGDSCYFEAAMHLGTEVQSIKINVEKETDVRELKVGTPLQFRGPGNEFNGWDGYDDVWFKVTAEEKDSFLVSLSGANGNILGHASFYVCDTLDEVSYLDHHQSEKDSQTMIDFDTAGTKYICVPRSDDMDVTITLAKPVVRMYEDQFEEKISLSKGSTVVIQYTALQSSGTIRFSSTELIAYNFSSGVT